MRMKFDYFCLLNKKQTGMKIKLLGKNLDELKRIVAAEGLPGFTAKQIPLDNKTAR